MSYVIETCLLQEKETTEGEWMTFYRLVATLFRNNDSLFWQLTNISICVFDLKIHCLTFNSELNYYLTFCIQLNFKLNDTSLKIYVIP